jgi:heptose I phosphotransferase
MTLQSPDRLHAKQGRSTARVAIRSEGVGEPGRASVGAEGPACRTQAPRLLTVYLKRHYRLPWATRWAALFHPAGRYSPAAAEWTHLERARALGIEVPEVVAAGEQIGPYANLQSFLIVAELTGCEALHEALPKLAERLDSPTFARLKRRLIPELARMTATLHQAGLFHKDLYLCHFFLDLERLERGGRVPRVVLIDLHRLGRHPCWLDWWRCKDLGQLLFSTYGVAGIDDGDRRRFWRCYRRITRPRGAGWQARLIRFRAARYARHNRNSR